MKCNRCNVFVKKNRGYPMIDGEEYCTKCFNFLRWRERIKREEEKRCQKN